MDCLRHLFDIPPDVHYINCAYNGPLLKSAHEAGLLALKKRKHPWQYTLEEFFEPVYRVKRLFSELIKAGDPDRIALIPSASYGIATAARNITLNQGDNIVMVEEQFPSNVYTWIRLCKEAGADLKIIRRPQEGGGKAWNRNVLDAIDDRTCAVAIGQVHWTDGTLFQLKEIRAKTTQHQVLLIIDGTQSIGAFPYDQQEIQADAVICAAYKWLLGPYGTAFAYFGPWFDGKVPIEENWINRLGSDDFKGLVQYEERYRPKANRYSVGENSNFIYIPILASSLKQVIAFGADNIQTYCSALIQPALETLLEFGFEVAPDDERGSHLFGIRIPENISPDHLNTALTKRNVHVSLRGNSIRVSPYVYNSSEDLDTLVEALKSVAH